MMMFKSIVNLALLIASFVAGAWYGDLRIRRLMDTEEGCKLVGVSDCRITATNMEIDFSLSSRH